MRWRFRVVQWYWVCISLTVTAQAYDLGTHTKITQGAFQASILGQGSAGAMNDALGLTAWVNQNPRFPFRVRVGDTYLELAFGSVPVAPRYARQYEGKIIEALSGANKSFTVDGWIMRGAIREDDGAGVIAGWKGEPLFDDPYGAQNRYCNHFFDPINSHGAAGRGYDGCVPLVEPVVNDAIQWALGSLAPFDTPPPEWTNRRNHFSILDAREAMWRALTLMDKSGAPAPGATFAGEELRKLYWATTFRALGDVLHTVQDMAQPQHTRNEGHPLGSAAIYEDYLEARARNERSFRIDGLALTSAQGQLPDLTYAGYQTPTFGRLSDYWSTQPAGDGTRKKGLADYSNRGFYTLNNNVDERYYPLPLIVPSAGNMISASLPGYPSYSFNYVTGTVPDDLFVGPPPVVTMATQGIFTGLVSPGTSGVSNPPLYMLTKQNFDDRADLLIPRAVAYSAGVLNYFFRGKLEISLPEAGVYGIVDHSAQFVKDTGGFSKIRLKIQNTTAAITPPGETVPIAQNMTGGILVAVVKFHRNDCYKADLTGEFGSPEVVAEYGANVFNDPIPPPPPDTKAKGCRFSQEEIVVSNPTPLPGGALVANDTAKAVAFDFANPIPINATDVVMQVVYRGPLGDEQDAVVVTTKDISEPTFVSTHNATDVYGPPGTAERRNLTIQFGFSSTNTTLVSSVDLKPGEFSRVAVLANVDSFQVYCGQCVVPQDTFQSALNQLGSPASTYYKLRTVVFGQRKLGLPGNPSQLILQPILGDAELNALAPAVLVPLQALPF